MLVTMAVITASVLLLIKHNMEKNQRWRREVIERQTANSHGRQGITFNYNDEHPNGVIRRKLFRRPSPQVLGMNDSTIYPKTPRPSRGMADDLTSLSMSQDNDKFYSPERPRKRGSRKIDSQPESASSAWQRLTGMVDKSSKLARADSGFIFVRQNTRNLYESLKSTGGNLRSSFSKQAEKFKATGSHRSIGNLSLKSITSVMTLNNRRRSKTLGNPAPTKFS